MCSMCDGTGCAGPAQKKVDRNARRATPSSQSGENSGSSRQTWRSSCRRATCTSWTRCALPSQESFRHPGVLPSHAAECRACHESGRLCVSAPNALQDSEDNVARPRETQEVHEPAVPKLAGLTNGGISRHVSRQAPEPAPATQRAQQAHRAEPVLPMDYKALPKPSPYPLEGDVIAYRLLHIGADWTPQVT